MYFEGGVSSVYLWDLEHGFAGTRIKRIDFNDTFYVIPSDPPEGTFPCGKKY